MNKRACLSEAIGTFFLVFIGTSAIVVSEHYQLLNHPEVALSFAAIVALMIFVFAKNSGAHFNPVVSLCFFMTKRLSAKDLLGYLLSQFSGAVLASIMLWCLFPFQHSFGLTQPSGSILQSFIVEIICTFLLVLVILNVVYKSDTTPLTAGIVIGSTVGLAALVAGPISGASMNPARSLGPALLSGELHYLWLYFLAPCVGSLLSLYTCRITHRDNCC